MDDSDLDVIDSGTICHHGLNCRAKVTIEPTGDEWGGDAPLEPGAEGYDISVEVRCKVGGEVFRAGASVCGHWITPDQEGLEYLDERAEEIKQEALDNVLDEIRRVGRGEDLIREASRMAVARRACEQGLGLRP